MKGKKKLIFILLAVVVILAVGAGAYASTGYGSRNDPLVTKSYLDDVLTPELMAKFESEISSLEGSSSVGSFEVLTLKKGQIVTAQPGCEVMLRIGTASAYGPDVPAMVDTSSGTSLSSGTALTVNHLCMITITGNGFRADSDVTKVLISGTYEIK